MVTKSITKDEVAEIREMFDPSNTLTRPNPLSPTEHLLRVLDLVEAWAPIIEAAGSMFACGEACDSYYDFCNHWGPKNEVARSAVDLWEQWECLIDHTNYSAPVSLPREELLVKHFHSCPDTVTIRDSKPGTRHQQEAPSSDSALYEFRTRLSATRLA